MSMSMGAPQASGLQVAEAMDGIASANPQFASGNPSMVMDAAQSSTPADTATVLAHAKQVDDTQQAITKQANGGGGIMGWIKEHVGSGPVGTALNWMAKPLQEIQADYKFIHAVYTQNGIFSGLLATAGIAGGAALGTFIGQPELGAAAAGEIERRLLGAHTSALASAYKLSSDPNYQVSFGRDVSQALSHIPGAGALGDTNNGWGKLVSGLTDATADFAADPLVLAGKASRLAKEGDSLTYVKGADGEDLKVVSRLPIARHAPIVNKIMQSLSIRAYSPEQIDAVYHGNPALSSATRTYRAATKRIAEMSPADIAVRFPDWQQMAPELGAAKTSDEVHKVLRDVMWDENLKSRISIPGILPTRTLIRGSMADTAQALNRLAGDKDRADQANVFLPKKDSTGKLILPGAISPKNIPSAISKVARTWTGKMPYTMTPGMAGISTKTINLLDPANYNSVYQMFRFGMGDQMARRQLNEFIMAPDIATRQRLFHTGQMETIKAFGMPNDSKFAEALMDKFGQAADGTIGGRTFGHGLVSGDEVSDVFNPGLGTTQEGLYSYHVGNTATFLNYHDVVRALRAYHGYDKAGMIDDGIRTKIIEGFFKPAALATGGFAFRIAAGELIQQMMRFSATRTMSAVIHSAAAKLNMPLIDGEAEHAAAAATIPLSGAGITEKTLPRPTADEIRAVHDLHNPDADHTRDTVLDETPAEAAANEYARRNMRGILKGAAAKGVLKLSRKVSEDDRDLAAMMILKGQGHTASGATQAGGHGMGDLDSAGRMEHITWLADQRAARAAGQDFALGKLAWREGAAFKAYNSDNIAFPTYWHQALSKASQNVAQRLIIRDVRDAHLAGASLDDAWETALRKETARIAGRRYVDDPTTRYMGERLSKAEDPYVAERSDLTRYQSQAPSDFAFARIDDTRNSLTGLDGTWHDDLARMVAEGRKPTLRNVESKDITARPKAVIGPELVPYSGGNLFNRVVQYGFNRVIDPIINNLSRDPLMFNATRNELRGLMYAVHNGTMTYDRAVDVAMLRATHAILPQIHNTALRSQLSVLATNFFPFWFAQEQAYRRVGRLIEADPAVLRKFQMIEQGITNPSFTSKDANGNRQVMIPWVGAWGSAAVNGLAALGLPLQGGLPMTATGNMASLRSVLPETNVPGVSPIVAVLGEALTSVAPWTTAPVASLVGEQSLHQSLIDELIPNAPIRSALKALRMDETDRATHASILNAIASAYYHGDMPAADASPREMAAFMDRIKNNARSALFLKAILGLASPLAPTVSVEDPGFRQEFSDLITKHKGDVASALHDFLYEHGDKAISYTIARTEPLGAKIPEVKASLDWVTTHQDLMSKYGAAAAFLVPPQKAGGYDQVAADELLKMHLRAQRTPEEFRDAIYISSGNNSIADSKAVHDANILAAGHDTRAVAAENAAWSQYVLQQRLGNPLWYDSYTSDDHRTFAVQALAQLLQMFTKGDAPNEPQAKEVGDLLTSFQNHSELATQARARGNTGSISRERDAWALWLKQQAGYTADDGTIVPAQNPALTTIIRSVFLPLAQQNLDLSTLANG